MAVCAQNDIRSLTARVQRRVIVAWKRVGLDELPQVDDAVYSKSVGGQSNKNQITLREALCCKAITHFSVILLSTRNPAHTASLNEYM